MFIAYTLIVSWLVLVSTVTSKPTSSHHPSLAGNGKKRRSGAKRNHDAYILLARSIQNRLNAPADSETGGSGLTDHAVDIISSALRSLSTAQAALKKIDGTAHEMYQRTHRSSTSLDDEGADADDDQDDGGGGGRIAGLKVAGRMSRNAARIGCVADALFAAELCELIRMSPPYSKTVGEDEESAEENHLPRGGGEEGTLAPWTGRKVVLNTTVSADESYPGGLAISVLVIHELDYNGGAGLGHGGVDDLLLFAKEELAEDEGKIENDDSKPNHDSTFMGNSSPSSSPRGRYLVILSDHSAGNEPSSSSDLPSIISILDQTPERLSLHSGNGGEAIVCGPLYHMAGKLLEAIRPSIIGVDHDASNSVDEEVGGQVNTLFVNNDGCRPAIHFVGHSLAGGVAAIAANILDGSLPDIREDEGGREPQRLTLSGSARGRASALCLGPPPCLSPDLRSAFVTSVIHGDDIVCRTTHGTVDHLCNRVRRSIGGGILGRSVGWMSEAVSLTVAGLKSNEGGSKGDKKLVVPGKAFLVRPRRIGGGSSSIHEVGGDSRDALRAALLWQLNDVLLSKSLWSHHDLDAYIHSLDRVRLKGFVDNTSDENEM